MKESGSFCPFPLLLWLHRILINKQYEPRAVYASDLRVFKSVLPCWNQNSELGVIHGIFEDIMLGIVSDHIDPGGLAYSSLTKDENVDVLLVIQCLQIQP